MVILGPDFSGKVRGRKRTFFGKFDCVDQLIYKSPATMPDIFWNYQRNTCFFKNSQDCQHVLLVMKREKTHEKIRKNARDGIRTQELLRDQALNLAPLTWLGYPRA
jgi:hypothetical protein